MCNIDTGTGTGTGKVTYHAVRKAMAGETYTMSLTDSNQIRAVVDAVNIGIDSQLEACFCRERGDRYEGRQRTVGKHILCRTLECVVSVESLPILLRRLSELPSDDDDVADAAMRLAGDILMTLGFDDYGHLVGREALGLA